jgi:hypothetical protein
MGDHSPDSDWQEKMARSVAQNRWTAKRLRFLADKIESHDVEFKGDPEWLSDDDSALLCSVIRSAAIMKELP